MASSPNGPDGAEAKRGQLLELSIQDFAIVDRLRLSLDAGLNALTGETGAGKSILIDALSTVLGDRASPNMVRAGAPRALIEATFERPAELPGEIELDPDDDVLILSREIGANGRGAARLNGRSVPVSMLQAAGRALVDMHGQSDHQTLMRPAMHLRYLDRFARADSRRDQVAALVADLRSVRQQIAQLQASDRDSARQADLLRFQIDEIGAAALDSAEEEELRQSRTLLANAERIRELAAAAVASLDGEGGALDGGLAAAKSLGDLARLDPALQAEADRLEEALTSLREVSRALARFADVVEADPAELSRVEDRLELIRTLKRKYGDSVDDILAYARQAQAQLDEIGDSGARLEALEARAAELQESALAAAEELSRVRQDAARALTQEVERELAELNMAAARFSIRIERRNGEDALQQTGLDDVEFLLAANPGEPLRPLTQVASGGEASRVMLALKSAFSTVDDTPVLVFDEIEVGVGARSGHVIGEKLRKLAHNHQVLCITHLAPVAAMANAHYRVRKTSTADSTITAIDRLGGGDRIDELADMLAGRPITDAARESARALLDRANTS